jgi:putative oxidoreductase
MFRWLLETDEDVVSLILRLALGLVMFPHGAQKVLGVWGGHGLGPSMGFFEQLGIPAVLGGLAIAAEFLGAIGLMVGLLTRVAALGIGINMVVAVLMVHLQYGFFMNWFGNQKGEGFEYHILAVAIALALVICGGGKWSLDRALVGRRPGEWAR